MAQTPSAVHGKLDKKPPYRLLALDGGGIRGLIAIEVLARIESILERRLEKTSEFVLADYFDYVAGTSTGAVIAACVALGMRVDEIRTMYLDSAELMFDKASIFKRLRYKYDDEPLARKMQQVFQAKSREAGDGKKAPTLGSSALKTLLMMVMRNVSTDSAWPISNNPKARFNHRSLEDCNLDVPLWQLVRASTAAPTFFPPEQVQLGRNNFVFVDGGVTTYNNPAFQLFLMATVEPYNVNWKTAGPEDMLIVSIGTGTSPQENGALDPSDMNLLFNASTIPSALMFAALNEQDFLCRTFGLCVAGDPLDLEVGDMIGKAGPTGKLFTYARYNAELTRSGLAGLGIGDIDPKHVQMLDSVEHKSELQRVGRAIADTKVKEEHFTGFLPL
ncbi:MAG: patatin-like phospholipase family protein [Burkholderiales bacterium]